MVGQWALLVGQWAGIWGQQQQQRRYEVRLLQSPAPPRCCSCSLPSLLRQISAGQPDGPVQEKSAMPPYPTLELALAPYTLRISAKPCSVAMRAPLPLRPALLPPVCSCMPALQPQICPGDFAEMPYRALSQRLRTSCSLEHIYRQSHGSCQSGLCLHVSCSEPFPDCLTYSCIAPLSGRGPALSP